MSGGSSPFTKMLDNVFPRIPPFLDMISLQAELLAKGMTVAVDYVSEASTAKFHEIMIIETQARELREKHLDVLNNAFSTPIDREDVLRSIVSLAEPVGSIRVVVEEMEALKIKSDNHLLEMAVVLREASAALKRGFSKLDTTPGQAEPDAQVGMQCLSNVDKIYRKALVNLYSIDDDLNRLRAHADGAEVQAMMHVVEMLKRREIYRHLRNIAGKVTECASVLHGIVVQIG
ncbi:MAG: DUF47 family protein [Magnetococcales bacterium]|nr:DUF47 family protein [Magnetococcales bacterium]NGZ05297.1 DUF47 family protein [Magnetococcales bacterium]